MRTHPPVRMLTLVIVTLLCPFASPALAAPGGNSENANACQQDGYLDWTREDGTPFANTGECVSYAAQGGTLVSAVEPGPELDFCARDARDAGFDPAAYNLISGTDESDDLTGLFTAGPDLACGFFGDDIVRGTLVAGDVFLGGRDDDAVDELGGGVFLGQGEFDIVQTLTSGTFYGGDRGDRVNIMNGGTYNGGGGKDEVADMYGGTFNGGDQVDVVFNHVGGTFNQEGS